MSYTIEDARRTFEAAAPAKLEAGDYVFRVAFADKKIATGGIFKGQEVLSLTLNPLQDPTNAASYDRGRKLYQDLGIPVFAEGMSNEARAEAQKRLFFLGVWASVLGVVEPQPQAPAKDASKEDKKAAYDARDAWTVNAANTLLEADVVGRCFRGTVAINDKGYPKLVSKSTI